MEVISRRKSSTLNPNAPCFVPSVYRQVEDFSDEWWELVNSNASFSDYWLQECFQDPQNDEYQTDDSVFLPDIESVFDGYSKQDEADEKENYYRELVTLSALKWRRSRGVTETAPKYFEKAPKFVNLKVNPRPIQQPR